MPRKKDMKFKNKLCYNLNHLKVKQKRKDIIFKNNDIQLKTEYFSRSICYSTLHKSKKFPNERTLDLWYLRRYICS
jgi:hypothetical protein